MWLKKLFSQSSGIQKSEIKVPSGGPGGESTACLSFGFLWLPAVPSVPWLVTPFLHSLPLPSSACLCLFLCPTSLCLTLTKDLGFTQPSLMAQTVKRLPAMRETWVRFLGREDPLEKEMAIHSSTLACKIPWTEETDRPHPLGITECRTRLKSSDFTSLHFRLSKMISS